MPPFIQSTLSLLVLGTVLSWIGSVGHAAPIRVRGVPVFKALRAQPAPDGGYLVTGFVRDAFDQPLSDLAVEFDAPLAHPCEPDSNVTGPDGEFCLRMTGQPGQPIVLSVAATELLDSARAELRLNPSVSDFRLQLELKTTELDLSRGSHTVGLRLESALPHRESYPVRLRLLDDPHGDPPRERFQRSLALAPGRTVDSQLSSLDLGPPGPARLVAEIAVKDQRLAHVERQVHVVDTAGLSLPKALGAVRPTGGFEVAVQVEGVRGPVDSGWVEVSLGETQVGLGKVADGHTVVPIRFDAPRREQVSLSFRYVAEQPWYRPGPTQTATAEVLPPPWWAHAPWALLAAIASYWIVRSWRRPGRASDAPQRAGLPEPDGAFVHSERVPNAENWSGRVCDVHTGKPVTVARVSIEVPTMDAIRTLVEATSDERDGSFLLPRQLNLPETARLVVRAAAHSELRRPVPPLGVLEIGLVERRRSLLLALTRWAKEMGRPWAGTPEPTPGQVAELARVREQHATRSWAEDIQSAAYGALAPNEAAERELTSRTPPLDRPSHHKR